MSEEIVEGERGEEGLRLPWSRERRPLSSSMLQSMAEAAGIFSIAAATAVVRRRGRV
jgi:hypothetical protein